MDKMQQNHYLNGKLKEFGRDNTEKYLPFYDDVNNDIMKMIFSKIHYEINYLFKRLNESLTKRDSENRSHYWAAESRFLLFWIEQIDELRKNLEGSDYGFTIDIYYDSILKKCTSFLKSSYGSIVPNEFERINLIITKPVFILIDSIEINTGKSKHNFVLRMIGEGSYATVMKYKDINYDRYFVVKRAKVDLSEKEIERFRQEFHIMKSLRSPYIVEVYQFYENKKEYVMECMDYTLFDYVQKNNQNLNLFKRKSLILQVLKAFDYIHSKNLFHRDINARNTLVKTYDDTDIVKISDFGLVKIPDSKMTSQSTEFKGTYNDPSLLITGFRNYGIEHETYALTRLIMFILTGKENLSDISIPAYRAIIDKGLNPDITKRFQSIAELREAINQIE